MMQMVTIMANNYNGYMPHSLNDKILMQRIGASFYFDLF